MTTELPPLVDIRIRSKIAVEEMEQKVGKILTDNDYNLLLTGPSRVSMPDGRPLCVHLPGMVKQWMDDPDIFDVLHSLRTFQTDNRGAASGSVRVSHGDKRTRSKKVASIMLGTFDPKGGKQFCRLSSWTSQNMPKYQTLEPLFQGIAALFQRAVPSRYIAQMAQIEKCDVNWYVPGTPFTTITVNNTYPTGVHKDAGDLEEGFSTLAVARRGGYSGGVLVFPEYRVGVDMQDGDLLLMDAHQFHGNTRIVEHMYTPPPLLDPARVEADGEHYWVPPAAERISVVSYMRTGVIDCGTADQEYARAAAYAEKGGTR